MVPISTSFGSPQQLQTAPRRTDGYCLIWGLFYHHKTTFAAKECPSRQMHERTTAPLNNHCFMWGKAMNRIMDRFSCHRADMRGDDASMPAFHFTKKGHKKVDMSVVVLEELAGKDDMYCITRERWRINYTGILQYENKAM